MGILDSFLKSVSGPAKTTTTQASSPNAQNHGGRRVDYDNLLKKAVAQLPPEALTIPHIGVIDPICPYCQTPLMKMPGAKTTCKSCGNAIYVMKRPSDNKKALFTASQRSIVGKLEGQKSRIDRMPEYLKDFKRELNDYQDLGLTQWRFLGCQDDMAEPLEREFDGVTVNIGSDEEERMLVYLCDPRYRFCTNAVINSLK